MLQVEVQTARVLGWNHLIEVSVYNSEGIRKLLRMILEEGVTFRRAGGRIVEDLPVPIRSLREAANWMLLLE